MSIEGITKIFDWMAKATPSKIFWIVVFSVYGVLVFEQFTDHYRLTRLTKAATVMEAIEPGPVREAIKTQIETDAEKVLLPKQASPVLWRMAGGAAPLLFFLIISLFSWQGWWNFCKAALCTVVAGGLIALIPDFLPTGKECFFAACVYMIGAVLSIADAVNDPTWGG